MMTAVFEWWSKMRISCHWLLFIHLLCHSCQSALAFAPLSHMPRIPDQPHLLSICNRQCYLYLRLWVTHCQPVCFLSLVSAFWLLPDYLFLTLPVIDPILLRRPSKPFVSDNEITWSSVCQFLELKRIFFFHFHVTLGSSQWSLTVLICNIYSFFFFNVSVNGIFQVLLNSYWQKAISSSSYIFHLSCALSYLCSEKLFCGLLLKLFDN